MRVASECRCLVMASRLHTGGSGQGAGIHDMMLRGRCNRLSVLVLQNGSEDVLPISYIEVREDRASLKVKGTNLHKALGLCIIIFVSLTSFYLMFFWGEENSAVCLLTPKWLMKKCNLSRKICVPLKMQAS